MSEQPQNQAQPPAKPQPAPIEPQRSAATVTVGCRLPNGLVLQLFAMDDVTEAVPNGYKSVKMARRLDETYTLNGTAIDIEKVKRGEMTHLIFDGAALTSGIPKAFWDEWAETYKDSEFVKNGHVFAHATDDGARRMATERAGQRTGLEPIDPEHPELHQPGIRRGVRTDDDAGR